MADHLEANLDEVQGEQKAEQREKKKRRVTTQKTTNI
jgi:hypothetical protein